MIAVVSCALPLPLVASGKVREVYAVGHDRLLLVATDRVSAFDVVMAEAVPYKGAVLTQMTRWWLERFGDRVAHHMLSADAGEIIAAVPELAEHRGLLTGRAMLVRRTRPFPIECVVRGYLAGSAWKEYRETGTLAGEPLRPMLREADRLDPPIFSPATKATAGHDENITRTRAAELVGAEAAARLERLALDVYTAGRDLAARRGILIADTKFEFGRAPDGRILLIDEVMTPDSSRFWPADRYRPGQSQPSFDKQPLRDYLQGLRDAGRWNGEAPPPTLPPDVVEATSARYLEAYRRITDTDLDLRELT